MSRNRLYVIRLRQESTIDLDLPCPAFRYWSWEVRYGGAHAASGTARYRWRAKRSAKRAARSLAICYWLK